MPRGGEFVCGFPEIVKFLWDYPPQPDPPAQGPHIDRSLVKPGLKTARLWALGLHIFVRGFSRGHKQRGLYPRGAYKQNWKSASNKVVLIKTRFAFTGHIESN